MGWQVTEDCQTIFTQLHWRLRNYLNRKHSKSSTNSDWFNEPHRWTVYPHTDPLKFQLVVIKPLHSPLSGEAGKETESESRRPLDQFRMVGEIESVAGGTVNIQEHLLQQRPTQMPKILGQKQQRYQISALERTTIGITLVQCQSQ